MMTTALMTPVSMCGDGGQANCCYDDPTRYPNLSAHVDALAIVSRIVRYLPQLPVAALIMLNGTAHTNPSPQPHQK
jgi:hypothetical protein